MSDLVKAVLIFLAGQASIFGIEWFRAWNAARLEQIASHWQRRIAAIQAFQDQTQIVAELVAEYMERRFLWTLEHLGREWVSNDFQATYIPEIGRHMLRLERAAIATRSEEIKQTFEKFDAEVSRGLVGNVRTIEEDQKRRDAWADLFLEMLTISEDQLAESEHRRIPTIRERLRSIRRPHDKEPQFR